MAQGFSQQVGIDFEETYAPIAGLEYIRMLLAYGSFMNFKLYQIYVKNAFLNGYINEELYVKQPLEFEDEKLPNHVYKLTKTLYCLRQTPRVWHEKLSNFFLENRFTKGKKIRD